MPLWEVGTFLGFCPVVVAPEAAGLILRALVFPERVSVSLFFTLWSEALTPLTSSGPQ